MNVSSIVQRQSLELRPNPSRVVVRPFRPATEPRDLNKVDKKRANHIVDRVLALSCEAATAQLADVLEHFSNRHRHLLALFDARAAEMEDAFAPHVVFDTTQRRLVGAYFMHEYSFEASALFNPSIVIAPGPPGPVSDLLPIILSVRAVGEGHVSSLTFRSGFITLDGTVCCHPANPLAAVPRVESRVPVPQGEIVTVSFDPADDISERVIFPVTMAQSNGIEDARFVPFCEGAETIYRATYTAYSGWAIRSEMIETRDFVTFTMTPMTGTASMNKGMALFPRRIDGRFAMIGRQDNENLYLLYSDMLHDWSGGVAILKPRFPWEFVQIGTCGSPIELDEGWLLLTHGVGPVRKYAIGAVLLDKDDPSIVLARSSVPLIRPEPLEREGYVPNVVYTCGALRHLDRIIIPYAISDSYCTFATVTIHDLLASLEGRG